jgi:hypothetical protein
VRAVDDGVAICVGKRGMVNDEGLTERGSALGIRYLGGSCLNSRRPVIRGFQGIAIAVRRTDNAELSDRLPERKQVQRIGQCVHHLVCDNYFVRKVLSTCVQSTTFEKPQRTPVLVTSTGQSPDPRQVQHTPPHRAPSQNSSN